MMPQADTPPVMTLGELLGAAAPAAHATLGVTDISLDSRRITPGALFLAVPGTRSHGLQHAAAAAAAGAACVAWEPASGLGAPRLPEGCVAFPVPGLRARLGEIADRFFGAPSRCLEVVGITGTNGKTTCAHLVAGALERAGRRAGLVGTLGAGPVGALQPSALTTPDVVEVHRTLADLAGLGLRAVAMEVSSHALDQGRVDGVRYAVAAFTNLSRDHLDYHPSLEAYGACKARLFLEHAPRVSVINTLDAFGRELAAQLPADARRLVLTADTGPGAAGETRLRLVGVEALADGLAVALAGEFGQAALRSPLLGAFNAENLAIAFGVLLALGLAPDEAADALGVLRAPAGRMEAFPDAARNVLAVVDYAHTPDALAKALTALRRHCRGRLWCVFGCGGDRDRGKRPEMGRIAEQLADEIVITDDNPRSEDGVAIVADILGGLQDPGRARVERDRAAAIRQALGAAQSGDVVLVAGKGHETFQIVGAEHRPFSDRALVAELTGAAA
ncbi:UDP-N-acetylmuramoyl-L-alanyl-D-glutamate--2,6-diaminopimelate ligase [Thioalkalivibrio sp. XN279]|uniref:UDP-N-acetylmuramoyl-L-alanyl-D-glutamate--2, 6-diaminopimelate ligase n=1 Tax=Thioalkalivibrio sp. XN279 TaxID=2714953 RepID=UPI00140D0080|nr:UDP-N-acetylmuramoyl-L-alanyl-D-glutamate--2,6-diaminopimelate ligase [Thioalkalivibrio sp. XN279]NHA16079.1 UDP-N-acetylmuramoyl-L-alanyl-D-glutamate--2,6-diaminopimelate ligase [Thioalkalivibrio sp. XN279]